MESKRRGTQTTPLPANCRYPASSWGKRSLTVLNLLFGFLWGLVVFDNLRWLRPSLRHCLVWPSWPGVWAPLLTFSFETCFIRFLFFFLPASSLPKCPNMENWPRKVSFSSSQDKARVQLTSVGKVRGTQLSFVSEALSLGWWQGPLGESETQKVKVTENIFVSRWQYTCWWTMAFEVKQICVLNFKSRPLTRAWLWASYWAALNLFP